MSASPADESGRPGLLSRSLGAIGHRVFATLEHVGAASLLLLDTAGWVLRALTNKRVRLGRRAIASQVVRAGVRSVLIISIVSGAVDLILVLQMAPPLQDFNQVELVANITAVALTRELGPLIAAIVLTGFAGAAIAAELGTMVVGEEIEALEAHALNPVRFLVVPRVIATVVSMTILSVIATQIGVFAGMGMGVTVLGIPPETYWNNTLDQLKVVDFVTGTAKGAVFGLLIGLIACSNGLRVTGGAAGVGEATTNTVVQSVVAIIIADLIFTSIFYATGLT